MFGGNNDVKFAFRNKFRLVDQEMTMDSISNSEFWYLGVLADVMKAAFTFLFGSIANNNMGVGAAKAKRANSC